MNPKENARRIIRFDNPERIVMECPSHSAAYFGCNHQSFDGGGHHLPVGSAWNDLWGVGWKKEQDGVMGFPKVHPLADLPKALSTYQWPDPDDERFVAEVYKKAKEWDKDEKFLNGSHRDTLWERSYMLVGMENMMCYFYTEPEAVKELLHRIMDFQLGIAKHYLKVGVEIAALGDDLGTQGGLLMSPKIVNEFLVPEYRRIFDLYKENDVLIGFHTCGHIEPLLEMFMALGVDILNPIQSTANNLESVRRATQGRMALQGGISSGLVMSGPVEAIKEEAILRMRQLGKDGGYFCRPDQGMPWPPGHREALIEAIEEFGRYPL